MEKELLKLLNEYHHYKFMSTGFWGSLKGWGHGMSLVDFMLWLESRESKKTEIPHDNINRTSIKRSNLKF